MNANVVYGLLTAILLVCYLIALRVKQTQEDVECVHNFVHTLGNHPMFAALMDTEGFSHMLERALKDKIRKGEDSEVPPPFKEWDDS